MRLWVLSIISSQYPLVNSTILVHIAQPWIIEGHIHEAQNFSSTWRRNYGILEYRYSNEIPGGSFSVQVCIYYIGRNLEHVDWPSYFNTQPHGFLIGIGLYFWVKSSWKNTQVIMKEHFKSSWRNTEVIMEENMWPVNAVKLFVSRVLKPVLKDSNPVIKIYISTILYSL